MEAFRQKRSKITSAIQVWSSGEQALRVGNRQVQKQGNFPKLASDSSSCSSGTTDEDQFAFGLGQSYSKQALVTPMKKLLAEEMSKEKESKRRAPSVIARLMGLDGLPTQQPAHKQQKESLERNQQRTISLDRAKRNVASYDRRSSRKSSKEQQEFKDVFEVLETPKVEGSSYSSQRTAKSKLTEAEMAFIQQKFMDAKRLSTNEKLQDSKEFHDALEALDSNKDLLLKFLQQPDSLFTKHLHDLQGAPSHSHYSRTAAVNSSYALKHDNGSLGRKSEREIPWKKYSKCPQRHHDSLSSHSYNRHTASSSHKLSKICLEGKDESGVLPTRIVVLKPNLGKVQNGTNAVSSPCSSHSYVSDCRHKETLSIKYRSEESWGKKNFPDDVGLSRHKSRESREIAKEITRQMRSSFSSVSMNFSSSGFRGFAGDDSSSNVSGNESANESEAKTVTSRNSVEYNNQFRPSSSRSTESSVNREAKKRLSERWKMNHKPREGRVISRGSTLGEMLAISDREIRATKSDAMIGVERFDDKLASSDESAGWVEPLGISSRDGWKDGCLRSLSRSRSLPSSSASFGSPKSNMRRETLFNEGYVMPKQATKQERNKAVKGNFNQRGLPRKVRSSSKKSLSCHDTDKESDDSSPEILLNQNKVKTNFEESQPFEQDLMVSYMPAPTVTNTVSESVVDVGHEEMNVSSEPMDKLLPEFSTHSLVEGNSFAADLDNLPQEPSSGLSQEGSVPFDHPVSQLETPESSKETNQPSPVSVLEAPFTDDPSSGSECFESLSADLHGLRMQLQLLKLESEASYVEGPMLISSDEDSGEGSVFSEEKPTHGADGSLESYIVDVLDDFVFTEEKPTHGADGSLESYIVDVLDDSGFNDANPDVLMATWYSPECPVNPLIFEELEKKYCHLTSWSRSERRLLFDRINSGLLEIYQQFTDPIPWAMPVIRRVVPEWFKDGLQGGLCKLLESLEKNVNEEATEKVVLRESQWLELGEDFDVIAREMEILLIDELVSEVVAM